MVHDADDNEPTGIATSIGELARGLDVSERSVFRHLDAGMRDICQVPTGYDVGAAQEWMQANVRSYDRRQANKLPAAPAPSAPSTAKEWQVQYWAASYQLAKIIEAGEELLAMLGPDERAAALEVIQSELAGSLIRLDWKMPRQYSIAEFAAKRKVFTDEMGDPRPFDEYLTKDRP